MLSETIPIQTYMGIYRKPHIDYTDVYWNDRDFPGGSVVKNLPANVDDGSIPASGRSPGEGNGKTFQYSCLRNPVDRGT